MLQQQQQQQLSPPPPKVGKYRYGERFAIGVAVSDPYLTHAVPVPLNRRNRNDPNDDNGTTTPTYFTAEIVPTFKGDLHNLHTSSPIFHTNLPYFRKDFLQHIGHVDIGAIVLALPMESSSSRRNAAFCPMPTKLQLEEERQSEEVRECLFGLLQNYVSVDNGEGNSVDEEDNGDGGALDSNKRSSNNSRRDDSVPFFGPLNVQGRINHRLSVADVLSKASDNGNWDHLVRGMHSSQVGSSGNNGGTYPSMPRGGRNFGATTDEDINGGPAMTVSPEMHAAVALNAMLERHTTLLLGPTCLRSRSRFHLQALGQGRSTDTDGQQDWPAHRVFLKATYSIQAAAIQCKSSGERPSGKRKASPWKVETLLSCQQEKVPIIASHGTHFFFHRNRGQIRKARPTPGPTTSI
eukprot:scaffold1189_cov71-Skeletonema_marinoi.AAC.4